MEDMEFLKAMLAEVNVNMKTNQERLEAKIDANRKADQERMQEMIRTNQEKMEEKIKEIMETVWFSSRQTGCLEKRDAGRPRNEEGHGFEGKS
jgi:hypothetical protein